jgi:hypothetical protein
VSGRCRRRSGRTSSRTGCRTACVLRLASALSWKQSVSCGATTNTVPVRYGAIVGMFAVFVGVRAAVKLLDALPLDAHRALEVSVADRPICPYGNSATPFAAPAA